jgi:hypothetical protein
LKPVLVLLVLPVVVAACASAGPGRPDADARLPASIERAVHDTYPGQRVVFCESRPSPSDGPVHEVTLDRVGLRTTVLLDDTGRILRERAELTEALVPAGILGTVKTRFPDRAIPLVIRWRENDRVHYEFRLLDPAGLTSTLNITPAGMMVEDVDGEGVPGPAPEEG